MLYKFKILVLAVYFFYSLPMRNNANVHEAIVPSDSATSISGYYIKVFNKKDITKLEKNRQNRLHNRPFSLPIDSHGPQNFFIASKELANSTVLLDSLFAKNKGAIYLENTTKNNAIFKAQFNENAGFDKCDTCCSLKSNQYFTIETDKIHCYQIFYIDGVWVGAKAGGEIQESIFREQIKYVVHAEHGFHVFILSKCNVSNRITDLPPLKLWKSTPGIFD